MTNLGIISHIVRLQTGQLLRDLIDPRLVFLEKDGAAAVVERSPHEAVDSQSEDQEVAGRLPLEDPE